ncbi:hypothetical protein RMAECT_0743 [Rickettsia rhipicephali str. Ect]|uniref:Uncharacterized protein n=1 Tax=Rickettsia rhipicephali str. Ect TaxID=1359199 RepID=A0A0F3PF36_RICRH|nr:hypothetical protein RMAECT_0743 [Rickettsia rhipicephali str. Ect]
MLSIDKQTLLYLCHSCFPFTEKHCPHGSVLTSLRGNYVSN